MYIGHSKLAIFLCLLCTAATRMSNAEVIQAPSIIVVDESRVDDRPPTISENSLREEVSSFAFLDFSLKEGHPTCLRQATLLYTPVTPKMKGQGLRTFMSKCPACPTSPNWIAEVQTTGVTYGRP